MSGRLFRYNCKMWDPHNLSHGNVVCWCHARHQVLPWRCLRPTFAVCDQSHVLRASHFLVAWVTIQPSFFLASTRSTLTGRTGNLCVHAILFATSSMDLTEVPCKLHPHAKVSVSVFPYVAAHMLRIDSSSPSEKARQNGFGRRKQFCVLHVSILAFTVI